MEPSLVRANRLNSGLPSLSNRQVKASSSTQSQSKSELVTESGQMWHLRQGSSTKCTWRRRIYSGLWPRSDGSPPKTSPWQLGKKDLSLYLTPQPANRDTTALWEAQQNNPTSRVSEARALASVLSHTKILSLTLNLCARRKSISRRCTSRMCKEILSAKSRPHSTLLSISNKTSNLWQVTIWASWGMQIRWPAEWARMPQNSRTWAKRSESCS